MKYIPAFSQFAKNVLQHIIPHRYHNEMSQKSAVVSNTDTVYIVKCIHEHADFYIGIYIYIYIYQSVGRRSK